MDRLPKPVIPGDCRTRRRPVISIVAATIRSIFFSFLSVFFLFAVIGCRTGEPANAATAHSLRFAVGLESQRSLVSSLTDEIVIVALPLGADPHIWRPARETIDLIAATDVYLASGLPFEDLLARRLREIEAPTEIVDIRVGMDWRPAPDLPTEDLVRLKSGEGERPDEAEEAPRSGRDPNVWFGFDEARHLIRVAATESISREPNRASLYLARMDAAIERVNATETEVQTRLEAYGGATTRLSDPILGYFLDDVGIVQEEAFDPRTAGTAMSELTGAEPETSLSLIVIAGPDGRTSARGAVVGRDRSERIVYLDPWRGTWRGVVANITAALETSLEPAIGTGPLVE